MHLINKSYNQYTHPWTKSEIDYVIKNIGNFTYKEMGKFLERSQSSIQSKVRFLPVKQKVKKYNLNQNFFKKWSQEMAYTLGFIATDGNICKSGNSHMLQLASDDEDVVYKIKKAMLSESPVHERTRQNGKTSFQFRISDQTIYADLLKLGIKPRKSLTLTPQNVPFRYLRHYIRGFFDGDGSVYFSHRGINQKLVVVFYTASYVMSVFLINKIKNICSEFRGKIQKTLTPNKDRYIYSIALGHRDSLLMYKYMYKNASIFMDRKHKKFLDAL